MEIKQFFYRTKDGQQSSYSSTKVSLVPSNSVILYILKLLKLRNTKSEEWIPKYPKQRRKHTQLYKDTDYSPSVFKQSFYFNKHTKLVQTKGNSIDGTAGKSIRCGSDCLLHPILEIVLIVPQKPINLLLCPNNHNSKNSLDSKFFLPLPPLKLHTAGDGFQRTN